MGFGFGTASAPLSTGDEDGNDKISCSVHATGTTSYSVDLDLDAEFGAVGVQGTVYNGSAPSAPVSLNYGGQMGTYAGSDCQLTLSTMLTPPIAPGRIAATVNCPTDAACPVAVTFIFQNCTE